MEQQEQFEALVDWLRMYSHQPRHLGCRRETAQERSVHGISGYALGEPRWNAGRELVSIRILHCATEEISPRVQ